MADARRHPHRSVVLEALDGVERFLPDGSRDNLTAVIADIVTRADPDDRWLEALPAV